MFNNTKTLLKLGKKSVSQYLKGKLGKEEPGMSNGENSFVYMSELLQKEGLYLLDEPENSLSP
jgi:predicted ATPase